MTKTNYAAICADIRTYGSAENFTRTMSDEHGVQTVLDHVDETSVVGRIRNTFAYEGDTRNWHCVGSDESLLYDGTEYCIADCTEDA